MSSNQKPVVARKRFGQNFLHDTVVLQQMVAAIAPQEDDTVVEIGPGRGALTDRLLQRIPSIHAIEIDRDLVKLLQQRYSKDQLTLYQQDVLKFDFDALSKTEGQLRVIGNLPYNITSPLLFHVFGMLSSIKDMHFLVQKEVADRLVAPVGGSQYGRLSVMARFFCDVEQLFDVPPTAFTPVPKVDSSYVSLVPHHRYSLSEQQFQRLSRLVQHVFSMKRKTLRKSLKSLLPQDVIIDLPMDLSQRPQEISIEQYISINEQIELE